MAPAILWVDEIDKALAGTRGSGPSGGFGRPATSGLPLTMTSPMKFSSLVARSRRTGISNSSGVWSMNLVVYSLATNLG